MTTNPSTFVPRTHVVIMIFFVKSCPAYSACPAYAHISLNLCPTYPRGNNDIFCQVMSSLLSVPGTCAHFPLRVWHIVITKNCLSSYVLLTRRARHMRQFPSRCVPRCNLPMFCPDISCFLGVRGTCAYHSPCLSRVVIILF